MSKTRITRFVALGDSLTDRGTLDRRYLLGFLPMNLLSGLNAHSPRGRFTNGYTWLDHFIAITATDLSIKSASSDKLSPAEKHIEEVKGKYGLDKFKEEIIDSPDQISSATDAVITEEKMSNDDLADAAITNAKQVETLFKYGYVLKYDNNVTYRGYNWVNCYAEGGLTAHDYSWNPILSIPKFFSRLILSTLAKVRSQLLAEDKKADRSAVEKKETLIMELSGANDLITVNKEPTKEEADKAVAERIKNVEILIQNGYENFVLLGLPDLSLTPRYQRKSPKEQEEAKKWSDYFNEELKKKCAELAKNNLHCKIKFFDMNKTFRKIYNEPEKYGFDKAKLSQPYIESPDFKIDEEKKTSPAKGYMFYDDVHPTADVHAILGNIFSGKYRKKFEFGWAVDESLDGKSEKELVANFIVAYKAQLNHDKNRLFGRFVSSNIKLDEKLTLKDILKHALVKNGERTKKILRDQLGWINKQGLLKLKEKSLAKAMDELQADLAKENASANVQSGRELALQVGMRRL